MSNQDEQDDFRRALTQQGLAQAPTAPTESAWERVTAGLRDAADRSTGWAAARVKDTFQDFVGRFLMGETTSPEPSDKWQQPEKEDKQPERDKGLDR
jgi:hypothetical protein